MIASGPMGVKSYKNVLVTMIAKDHRTNFYSFVWYTSGVI